MLARVHFAEVASGDNEIFERSNRAHPFEFTDEPGKHELGSSQEAFPTYTGLYIE